MPENYETARINIEPVIEAIIRAAQEVSKNHLFFSITVIQFCKIRFLRCAHNFSSVQEGVEPDLPAGKDQYAKLYPFNHRKVHFHIMDVCDWKMNTVIFVVVVT